MSVIGNPITLGGGAKVPQPSGNIYNAGAWQSDVLHGLISSNGGWASETSSYICVNLPANANRYSGVLIGPVKIGSGYLMTGRGPSSYGEKAQFGAILDYHNITSVNGTAGDVVVTDDETYKIVQCNENASLSFSLNTSSLSGKTGFIYFIFQMFNYGNARNDARITRISAT